MPDSFNHAILNARRQATQERIQQICEQWQKEFLRTTGKNTFQVTYQNGWFCIDNAGYTDKFRLADAEKALNVLKSRHTHSSQMTCNYQDATVSPGVGVS